MKFGPVAPADAEGALLAHALSLPGGRLRKAHRLTGDDVRRMEQAGIASIVVARLEPGDVEENEAATRIAAAIGAPGISVEPAATGRVNLYADAAGVFTVDRSAVNTVNAVDPSITIATLGEYATVSAGQMVATIKIIPFAVAELALARACEAARANLFAVHPFRLRPIGLIQTTLEGVKASVLDKTARVTAERFSRSGNIVARETRVPHEAAALAAAIGGFDDCDLVIVFGASALCDWDDVIPSAIRLAGGTVERAGMPVDPGNLLVLGEIAGRRVIGAPGCARSPKLNGFDWVLDRILADVPVGAADIARMGVGGLLTEIPQRPQPRGTRANHRRMRVHAAILAAGRSSRMEGPNKLLSTFDGVPLVRRVADVVTRSRVSGTHVVLGHQAADIAAVLDAAKVELVQNPAYADGLSTSLKAAWRAMPAGADGLLVVLGDMPGLEVQAIDRMIEAFDDAHGGAIVRAVDRGKRGNPVLLPREMLPAVEAIEGDTGARHLVEAAALPVIDVEIGAAASLDVDTREAVEKAGGIVREDVR